MLFLRILLVTFKFLYVCHGFEIPPIKLEAFKPSGFRVSIKAEPGIQLFAFHGNKNNEISLNAPGEFASEVRHPEGGRFVYYDPDRSLDVGDVIHYWVFVQHNRMGHRKDALQWTVDGMALRKIFTRSFEVKLSLTMVKLREKVECEAAVTILNGRKDLCVGDTIIDEEFHEVNDYELWLTDQYIPVEPDYEFVVYKKDPDVVYTENDTLVIKPKIVEGMSREIDLRNGCTKSDVNAHESLCYQAKETRRDIKIVSGRITSKVLFTYGEVIIKAKLPLGDWIYPEIFLEEADDTGTFNKKIVIAYSRGNLHLSGSDNINIGGFMLFGGPMAFSEEPQRSRMLSSYRSTDSPFSKKFHIYKLIWNPDRIELFVDETKYGLIESSAMSKAGLTFNSTKARLVLGVGVGGINDFPDNYKSSNNDGAFFTYYIKPWNNREVMQEQKFFKSKSKWLPSWNEHAQLEVEYVKIHAL